MRWLACFAIVLVQFAGPGCKENPSNAAPPQEQQQVRQQPDPDAFMKQWPPIEMPSVIHVGDVSQDETVSRTVDLTNVGEKAVRIAEVRSNCTCTVPRNELAGTVIAPGETFSMPFEFGGEGRTGRRSAEIRVVFHDYERLLLMRVEANVTPARR